MGGVLAEKCGAEQPSPLAIADVGILLFYIFEKSQEYSVLQIAAVGSAGVEAKALSSGTM